MGPTAVPTETVLLAEFAQIWPDEKKPAGEASYRTAVFAKHQAALCLSGGGIRSAAFALGILQSLAAKGLLNQFHYLSTVSGGGYIGSWLQRWIAESGRGAVQAELGGSREPPQVRALRENSNYLTPRIGIGSNDTWTALALSIRNILINGMLFAPLFLLLGLFPNLVAAAIGSRPLPATAWTLLAIGTLCLCRTTYFTCRLLPSYRSPAIRVHGTGDSYLVRNIVLPLALWGVLATITVSPLMLDNERQGPMMHDVAAANVIAMLGGVVIAWARAGRKRAAIGHDSRAWVLAAIVASLGLYFSAIWTVQLTNALHLGSFKLEVLTTLGPILATGAQFVATIVFVVFRPAGTARVGISPDADREWLSRMSALKLKPALLWAAVGLATFGVVGVLRHYAASAEGTGGDLSFAGIVSLVSGGVAVLGGRSSKSGGPTFATAQKVIKIVPMKSVVALATAVFALAILSFHAGVEQIVAGKLTRLIERTGGWPDRWFSAAVAVHLAFAAALAIVLHLMSSVILVNRFSLTGLYRNRLARAFLGSARLERAPDPFTGFDPADNIRVHDLLRKPDDPAQRLYPLINVALNVTSSERLAWQERKAEPFVFTPLYSGSETLTREGKDPATDPAGAFLPSNCYGGNEPDLALAGSGVSLATAMAISGAAASPNQGYNSSPATAFLMSLFNVRLGAWLPNPARAKTLGKAVTASGPSDNLRAMLRELAGSTQDSGRDIYLSDGGHFDNLGIYEMIRRRCRYIVVSDAGCDPNCRFEDLGNAVRKVAIDQNVRIEFDGMHISDRTREIKPQFAYATGTIHYPESTEPGRILYIKPSFFGSIPIDVRAYAAGSPTFPHETTGDQFFSESQFESYRALGRYFTKMLGGDASDIPAFFDALDEPALDPVEFQKTAAPLSAPEGTLPSTAPAEDDV